MENTKTKKVGKIIKCDECNKVIDKSFIKYKPKNHTYDVEDIKDTYYYCSDKCCKKNVLHLCSWCSEEFMALKHFAIKTYEPDSNKSDNVPHLHMLYCSSECYHKSVKDSKYNLHDYSK